MESEKEREREIEMKMITVVVVVVVIATPTKKTTTANGSEKLPTLILITLSRFHLSCDLRLPQCQLIGEKR